MAYLINWIDSHSGLAIIIAALITLFGVYFAHLLKRKGFREKEEDQIALDYNS